MLSLIRKLEMLLFKRGSLRCAPRLRTALAISPSTSHTLAHTHTQLEMIDLLRFIDVSGDDDISVNELLDADARASSDFYHLTNTQAGRALQRLDKFMLERRWSIAVRKQIPARRETSCLTHAPTPTRRCSSSTSMRITTAA